MCSTIFKILIPREPLELDKERLRSTKFLSGYDLLEHTGAVAMTLGIDADAVEQGEPSVAQRRVLWGDDVVAELETSATTGE